MDDSTDNRELLLDCLEDWESAETRRRLEAWRTMHPDALQKLAEQRAMDLALRARAGRDASHLVVREKILLSIKEQTAPAAIRESIVSAVQAEARRNGSRLNGRWSRVRNLVVELLTLRGLSIAAVVILGICTWMLMRPKKLPLPVQLASVETVSGHVERAVRNNTALLSANEPLHAGESIRLGSNGAVSLVLTNGAFLNAGPGTELSSVIEKSGYPARWVLSRGILAASTPPIAPLWLETPHLKIAATNASFHIESSAEESSIHVTAGTAVVSRAGSRTSVTAGRVVQARSEQPDNTPLAATLFQRDMLQSPFSSASPWNTSIGSGAMYARITAPGWPAKNLTNAVIVRPIFVSSQSDPRVQFLAPSEEPRGIRYPSWWNPVRAPGEFVCALFPGDRLCCEMTEPVRLPSGDVQARERNSTDLTGSGVGWSWPRPRSISGSAFAGLIRRGELTLGIQHALALAVNARYLNATGGVNGHRWPGVPVAPELLASLGDQGNLVLGALLVIRTNVNLSSLGVGNSGPGFEIARALQDYGAYVIQTTDGEVKLISAPDAGLPPDIDAIASRLVPHLVLVSNNSLRNVGGGGERRRSAAAPLAP